VHCISRCISDKSRWLLTYLFVIWYCIALQELEAAGLLATAANPTPSPFTWQLLGKLQYLQAVIREGLRLFSPAANGSFRMNTAAELQLKPGLVIPKVN
jgi:cytochrome P450